MISFLKYGLKFRTVEIEDAQFILQLRNDEWRNKYLNPTSSSITEQEEWLKKYKERERNSNEYYFISEDLNGNKLGLNRIYNMCGEVFEIGSWLYSKETIPYAAILGDLAIRDYGFEILNYCFCRFDVRKGNLSVLKYHNGFKPILIDEDAINYYFELHYNSYKIYRDKLIKAIL
jgi:hypothetical protein